MFKKIQAIAEYEVFVAGAGLAGFSAAVAAARQGVKTILAERLEMLGGLGASGCVGNFCAAEGGLEGQGKVFDDILSLLFEYGAIGEENGWPVRGNKNLETENRMFDYNLLPIVLQEIALDSGVDLLYGTDVIGAELTGNRITHAVIHNKSLIQKIKAKVFIDGTGEGILARHAGAEILPDDPGFPGVIKPSNMIFVRWGEAARPMRVVCEPDEEPDFSTWPDTGGRKGLKMKLFHREFDTGTGDGYNEAVIEFRKLTPAFVRAYQKDQGAEYTFNSAAGMLGLREGRRIKGDYILTIDDLRAEKRFSDCVAYGTFTVDANRTREILPPYQIPLSSLLADGLENCMVPGRCFSADRLALSSARVMPTCSMMGSGCGVAAAVALSDKTDLRSVDTSAVRERLYEESENQELMRERMEE